MSQMDDIQSRVNARADMDLRLKVSKAVDKLQCDMGLGNNVELEIDGKTYLVHDLFFMLREAIIAARIDDARLVAVQNFLNAAEALMREGDANVS